MNIILYFEGIFDPESAWIFEGVEEEHVSQASVRQSGRNHWNVVPWKLRFSEVFSKETHFAAQ